MEVATIDLSKSPEVRRIWDALAEKIDEECNRLREIEEQKEREARARYGDPVIGFATV